MTRKEAKEFYPILQAYAEGKVIECRTKPSAVEGTYVPNDWAEMKEIAFWKNTFTEISLYSGSIKKLIGRELSFSDEPVELK